MGILGIESVSLMFDQAVGLPTLSGGERRVKNSASPFGVLPRVWTTFSNISLRPLFASMPESRAA